MKIVVGDKWRLFSGCDLVAGVKSEVGEVGEVVSEQEQGQGGEGGGVREDVADRVGGGQEHSQ